MKQSETLTDLIVHEGQRAVVLENGVLKVVLLLERGGKTASILHKAKAFELLAQPSKEYGPLVPAMDFSGGDASGFDDAFPSIDPETVTVGGKAIAYPDHGEIWTMEMQAEVLGDGVLFSGHSGILPYRYEKKISLCYDTVSYHYRITHTGGEPFPCLWVGHGLIRYEPDMRLEYPAGASCVRNVLSSGELGAEGSVHTLTGGRYDFNRVPPVESDTMIKYYLTDACRQGRCVVYYPSQTTACELTYDADVLPYLGFWLTAGGYRGEYNCAFEPATGYYDSVSRAVQNDTAVMLAPGKPLSFSLSYRLYERTDNT